ncbi:chromosomal replication initiator protein DnaA [Parabacteroides sp. An277]|uniref:chromosomal replication initiator protein DnaA n=1 Tax=Parabacteroides sp. An277 TaxID=1965619 RepID=UPI000B383B1A|nr:chromosomal replication initiator protein DnaA [Parabacteroides sp. An277]OUO54096.1 chromosomal replication initiator protein DnaA [Parabacteroides sp. An277]
MQSDCQILWKKCLEIIKDNLSEEQFNTWFRPIIPYSFNEKNEFRILVPSNFFGEYIEANFQKLLLPVVRRVMGPEVTLIYRVATGGDVTDEGSMMDSHVDPSPTREMPHASVPNLFEQRRAQQDWNSYLNSKYSFDNYFEGTSNKVVRSASEAIAQNPGKTAFNPMFIFGASGVGKTHLCHAIGNRIQELHPSKKVLYVSAHLFGTQFTEAVRKNNVNDFLYFYQGVDVLIIDDVQEFIGKDKTQNTFFHIFNHLHMLNKQLVLTSDKPPVELQGMEKRLFTRLKWGLIAELEHPDLDLRRKILKNKITHDGLNVPEDVFNFIADNVTENVRDLEGILVSLMANALVSNKEIDLSLTKRIVSHSVRLEQKQLSVQSIQETVCKYFNLDQSVIQTNSRKREIVQARQITMFLAKKYTDCSFSHIGKIVGKKDHATVLHACKTIKDQMETNKSFRTSVEEIESLLRS